MATTQALIDVLKTELKAAGITYAALARDLSLSESSIKRMFAQGEMPLSRVDDICRVLRTDYAELSRRVAASVPLRSELTLAQEQAVVADRVLLLVAMCVLSQWSLAQIVASYRISQAQTVRCMTQLDRLGIIELRPLNRYSLKLAKTFRWRPNGPVMAYFRGHVVADYFDAGFDGESELLMLVHGQVGRSAAAAFNERLQRLAQDFAQQQSIDQNLARPAMPCNPTWPRAGWSCRPQRSSSSGTGRCACQVALSGSATGRSAVDSRLRSRKAPNSHERMPNTRV